MKRVKLSHERGAKTPPSTYLCTKNGRGTGKYANPFRIVEHYASVWRMHITDTTPAQLEIFVAQPRNYHSKAEAQAAAADCFRQWLDTWPDEELSAYLAPLRPYEHLACWCGLDSPCHVDVIIKKLTEK